jgi:hypothetical protein
MERPNGIIWDNGIWEAHNSTKSTGLKPVWSERRFPKKLDHDPHGVIEDQL